MKLSKFISFVLLLLTFMSCEDFLDKEPVDSIADQSAITDLKSAQAALDGLYFSFNGFYNSNNRLLGLLGDMSDEQNEERISQFTLNTVQPEDTDFFWDPSWVVIHQANTIIQKIPAVNALREDDKRKFIAEAKFIRAFQYLLCIQFWVDFPWTEETDFRVVQDLARTPVSEVHNNIVMDLLEAEQGLPTSYEDASGNRARVIKGAATALLARTFLYMGNWDEAESKATEVIGNSLYELAQDYQSIFDSNSNESILEYSFSDVEGRLTVADLFLPVSLGGTYFSLPTSNMEQAFEVGDLRKAIAISTDPDGLLYISKYQETSTNQEVKILRLAEMYLIRAEARAQQSDIIGAAEDLDVIRNRAGLPNTTASDQVSMLAAIEQERFIELCFEGHRWIDLVRTDRVDEVMGAFNPGTWQQRARLLPIPQSEIDLNPNLTQNPGY